MFIPSMSVNQAVLRADTLAGKGCQQTRLCLQRFFRLAQRGKGHDEGMGNGIFHVQVQTADDQHVHGQANF